MNKLCCTLLSVLLDLTCNTKKMYMILLLSFLEPKRIHIIFTFYDWNNGGE